MENSISVCIYASLTTSVAVFEAHWLQITAINMMGGRITGTVAWVVLLIGLSVSRADFRIISVSKCANHLAEFIYVICFMLEDFFEGG